MSALASAVSSGPGHERRTTRLATMLAYAFLCAVTLASVYPLVLMAVNSLKSNSQVAVNSAGFPHPATLSSYRSMVNEGALRSFANSLLVAAATTVGAVVVSGLAGYSFAKLKFRGARLLFAGLLGTIMVPVQTALPGFYTEFARFH
jgi:ABC-type glycerol-3-phosphate transport system permease component